jgi:hypothetical protein
VATTPDPLPIPKDLTGGETLFFGLQDHIYLVLRKARGAKSAAHGCVLHHLVAGS